jgi:acyl-coenzyme A synthetase/AMP-(fatty) acid ligase
VYARQHALEHPEQPAIIMATSGETVTYGEYESRCNRAAHLLRAAGLERGDHIAVMMENSPRLLEIEGAAERTGLYFTLINTYLAPNEVAYIAGNSGARMLFTSPACAEVAVAAAATCRAVERRLITGPGEPPAGWESYEAAVDGYPGTPVPGETLGTAMFYSSGTTGQPKGILRGLPEISPSDPLPVMLFVRNMFGFREGMTYLNPAPIPPGAAGERLRITAARCHDGGHGALRRGAVAGDGRAL